MTSVGGPAATIKASKCRANYTARFSEEMFLRLFKGLNEGQQETKPNAVVSRTSQTLLQ